MLDFIMGWILGKNTNKINNTPIEVIVNVPKEEIKQEKEVIKYVYIPEIYDFTASLEEAENDYIDKHMITLYKDGHIEYYLEVLVPESQLYWGEQKLKNYI